LLLHLLNSFMTDKIKDAGSYFAFFHPRDNELRRTQQYLADLFHECATEEHPHVLLIN